MRPYTRRAGCAVIRPKTRRQPVAASHTGKVIPLGEIAAASSVHPFECFSEFASARTTITAWVFDARNSHQPSPLRTRTPSISIISASRRRNRPRTSSTIANLRASSTSIRTSGVVTTSGSLSRIAASVSDVRPRMPSSRTAT